MGLLKILILKAIKTSGDYHGQMNSKKFETLITNIIELSIIVFDNAPYHYIQQNKLPANYLIKAKLINWETDYIPFQRTIQKAILIKLIKKHKLAKKYSG